MGHARQVQVQAEIDLRIPRCPSFWHCFLLFLAVQLCGYATTAVFGEDVRCDLGADTSNYFCRGWQDGVGPEGTRVRFIARMIGEDYEDDFGKFIVPLGDINSDGRSDFMVWVPGKCEWRIFHGDTLISKEPALVWPRCSPGYPGNFALIPDISGDGEPDLFRFGHELMDIAELYFAGAAFDTICDLVFQEPEFELFGGAGGGISGGKDINGDSQPDFIIGDPSFLDLETWRRGRAYLFWGGSALDSIPDLIFTDTVWQGQNQSRTVGGVVQVIESINGDPYADIVIGRASSDMVDNDPPGRVQIHFGGPSMDTTPDIVIECPDTAWSPDYGYQIAALFGGQAVDIGDCNLDGYSDLLLSGWQIVPAYIYFGGPDFDTVVDLRLVQPWPTESGNSERVSGLGDVNGDGHADFCTVRRADGNLVFDGFVRVHLARSNIDGTLDWSIDGADWYLASESFGRQTKSLGDVDGDGIDDIAVGTMTSMLDWQNLGAVYIFAGYSDESTGVFDDPLEPAASAPVPRLLLYSAPNPFNSGTRIQLSPDFRGGDVIIYDILGRPVRHLLDGPAPETETIAWNGRDDRGQEQASGLYFARATSGMHAETLKLVLLK